MASGGSVEVVIAALVGNSAIAVTKFAAAAYTGSSAMFSEGIHSAVDTGNQALLLFGMKRAARPADERHPFGYSREIYFWAFVVAILIFSLGAGVSIYEGIEKIRHPHEITSAYINYIVLGIAIAFESVVWWVALKEFNKVKGHLGYFEAVRVSKDAPLFTVLLEDTAALLGLITAMAGVFAADVLGMPALDGVASVVIGLILALTAVLLAYETKALLIGEAADPAIAGRIKGLAEGAEEIVRVNEVLTTHLGPDDVLINVSLDFRDHLSAAEVEAAISAMERQVKSEIPEVRRIFIEAQSWQAHRRDRASEKAERDGGTP